MCDSDNHSGILINATELVHFTDPLRVGNRRWLEHVWTNPCAMQVILWTTSAAMKWRQTLFFGHVMGRETLEIGWTWRKVIIFLFFFLTKGGRGKMEICLMTEKVNFRRWISVLRLETSTLEDGYRFGDFKGQIKNTQIGLASGRKVYFRKWRLVWRLERSTLEDGYQFGDWKNQL